MIEECEFCGKPRKELMDICNQCYGKDTKHIHKLQTKNKLLEGKLEIERKYQDQLLTEKAQLKIKKELVKTSALVLLQNILLCLKLNQGKEEAIMLIEGALNKKDK